MMVRQPLPPLPFQHLLFEMTPKLQRQKQHQTLCVLKATVLKWAVPSEGSYLGSGRF